ncbi:hypothetical protein GGR56DRAFT_674964 [Xylariaceae sp. FL0804]|nr:hypothetical protein GGR56DRAFT_674964 [Xylariaceae sp. FL0804]
MFSCPPHSPLLDQQRTYACGHIDTDDPLPKLVHYFRTETLPPPPSDDHAGPGWERGVPCASCQLAAQAGIEEAVAAVEIGPESLVDHDTMQETFLLLLERFDYYRQQQLPQPLSSLSSSSSSLEKVKKAKIDWEYVWGEWARAFEAHRARAVHLPELFRNLRTLLALDVDDDWWAGLLRRLGAEALAAFGVLVEAECVPGTEARELPAFERDAHAIESVDDLERFLADLDERLEGSLGELADRVARREMRQYPKYLRR